MLLRPLYRAQSTWSGSLSFAILSENVIYCVISTAGRDLKPTLTQILPIRINSDNQRVFLLPSPFLDLFFPGYRCANVGRFFEIDQLVDVIFFGKTLNLLCLMFIDPANEVVGYPNVHDLVVLVRQQVDVKTRHVGLEISPCGRNDRAKKVRVYNGHAHQPHLAPPFRSSRPQGEISSPFFVQSLPWSATQP